MIAHTEIYPKNWMISVSNDNKTWEIISENKEPLCSEENSYDHGGNAKDFCRIKEHKSFEAKHVGYHYFVKFNMSTNSYYYADDGWKYVIVLNGFELNGYFYNEKPRQFSCRYKTKRPGMFALFLSCMLS